jgi:hypothetical protein
MVRTPTFFLVGAPKCGTTAMHEYLGAHPDVFVPERKEPHHFGQDIRSPRFLNERHEYLALFEKARDEKAVGEASVWYLASTRAAAEIAAFEPQAKILVMLRDPVELVRSLHSFNVANGIEDITDLGVALDAGTKRFETRIVGRPAIPEFLDYTPIGHFADQLARFQAVFPPDQIHVVIYEEFARDPATAYRGVLEFLGVGPTFRPAFERVNAARRSRSTTLARWLHAPPPRLQRVLRSVVPGGIRRRVWHRGLKRALTRANTEPATALPMSPAVRARLRAEYADDVRRTARLIDRPDLVRLWGYEDLAPEGAPVERTPVGAGT